MNTPMQLSDFDFVLPEELIAPFPLAERSASRLLCLNKNTGEIAHRQFRDILSIIQPQDLLVLNNTKVISARLWGQKESGGRVEVLVERVLDDHRVLAMVRASKSPKPQTFLIFENSIRFEVLARHYDLFELRCEDERHVLEVIESIGQVPLPHYFNRAPEESDKVRYQTVYAKHKGSVAAPTAGLHFDNEILAKLTEKGVEIDCVTLHVGAGTFAPVRVDDITQHRMHKEYIEVSEALVEKIKTTKKNGGRVIAVGTTTARSLETASQSGEIKAYSGETDIFIYPGYQFKCIDALITNFHFPCSTLLMMVCALGGYENVMHAYRIAVDEKYRFFSYGDAMWVG